MLIRDSLDCPKPPQYLIDTAERAIARVFEQWSQVARKGISVRKLSAHLLKWNHPRAAVLHAVDSMLLNKRLETVTNKPRGRNPLDAGAFRHGLGSRHRTSREPVVPFAKLLVRPTEDFW